MDCIPFPVYCTIRACTGHEETNAYDEILRLANTYSAAPWRHHRLPLRTGLTRNIGTVGIKPITPNNVYILGKSDSPEPRV